MYHPDESEEVLVLKRGIASAFQVVAPPEEEEEEAAEEAAGKRRLYTAREVDVSGEYTARYSIDTSPAQQSPTPTPEPSSTSTLSDLSRLHHLPRRFSADQNQNQLLQEHSHQQQQPELEPVPDHEGRRLGEVLAQQEPQHIATITKLRTYDDYHRFSVHAAVWVVCWLLIPLSQLLSCWCPAPTAPSP